jgi:hypothetical protein
MGKTVVAFFFGLVLILGGISVSTAHQAGGVEVGDLETGSVVGQPFKELPVDYELFAIEIGNTKVWYPPATIIDFKARPGRPLVLKVTNNSAAEHGFMMTADTASSSGAPPCAAISPGADRYCRRRPASSTVTG